MEFSLPSGGEWVDIGIGTLLIYGLLASARSVRSVLVIVLLSALAFAYALARMFGYPLSSQILQLLLVSGCAYAVFISHDDMRRSLDRLSGWLRVGRVAPSAQQACIEAVVVAVQRMAESRHGALIVFPGTQSIEPDVHGGVELDAKLSVPMLLSLFDPSSPGHDGALIVRHGRAAEFAVHLPLSTNDDVLGDHGTRHAAALGLSERTDALCVVVSEERGKVSVAHRGALQPLDSTSELTQILTRHLAPSRARARQRDFSVLPQQMLLAVTAALVGWYATVQGREGVTRTLAVPVTLESLPEGYTLRQADPEAVQVTVSGPRNELLLLSEKDIELGIDGWSVRNGRRSFLVSPTDVRVGQGLTVRAVRPRVIRVEVAQDARAESPWPNP
jgi:uncharacterized protein (TIGR00159 family)